MTMYRIVETYQGHLLFTQPKAYETLEQAARSLRAQVADGRVHRDLAIKSGRQYVPRKEWAQ
jgi:hypothetical protein